MQASKVCGFVIAGCLVVLPGLRAGEQVRTKAEVLEVIGKVNDHWQEQHPEHGSAFWHRAVYHVGNMAAYEVTKDRDYLRFSTEWAERNDWKGAKSDNRDAKYVHPGHKSVNGRKDFWARGNGWVFTALPMVIDDLPEDHPDRAHYLEIYREMAAGLKASQQEEGYWTRSILDPAHAPGPEASGTAFFTCGFLWGLRTGVLDSGDYGPVAREAWDFLTTTSLQDDGRVGYIQPIGEKAIPGQVVDASSTADFGVGAFLLAAAEMVRFVESSMQ